MAKMNIASVVAGLFSFGLLAACAGTSSGARSAAEGGLTSDELNAAKEIAAARCARQTPACGASLDAEVCIERKLLPSAWDLDLANCFSAVDQDKLKACVVQIRAGRCGTGIVRIDACARDNLCPGGYSSDEGTT